MYQTSTWIEEASTWTRIVRGAPGQPNLMLVVFPEPADGEDPWVWEVIEPKRPLDRELKSGAAETAEIAKASAEQWAVTRR